MDLVLDVDVSVGVHVDADGGGHRALGDMVAKTAGVISTPYRVSKAVKPNQRVFVVASDGLWDFVPNEEAILIASQANDSRTAAVGACGSLFPIMLGIW